MSIKGLLNFDSSCWNVDQRAFELWSEWLECWSKGFLTLIWVSVAKSQNLGLDFKWGGLCCSIVIFLCSFLIWKKKKIISKKTLMDFCGSLKNIFLFATWNLEFEILKLETWDFETLHLEILKLEILKICNLKFLKLEIWEFATWNFETWDFEILQLEIFETWDLRICNLKFWTWNFEIEFEI